jgi:hypothetical protein
MGRNASQVRSGLWPSTCCGYKVVRKEAGEHGRGHSTPVTLPAARLRGRGSRGLAGVSAPWTTSPLSDLPELGLVADSIAQVKHPVALDHRVRVLEQMLGIDRPEVPLA